MHTARFLGWLTVMLAASSGIVPGEAVAQSQGSVEERLQRLERLLQTDALLQMLESVDALKKEVRDLRGQIELQTHTISQLKQRQRELYLDVDQRLQRIETRAPTLAAQADSGASDTAGESEQAQTLAAATGTQINTGSGSGSEVDVPAAGTDAITASATAQPQSDQTGSDTGQAQLATAAATVDPVQEQRDYQAAFGLLKTGRYDDAAEAFREFLDGYPGGQFADNAQYWLGETFYVTRQFESAMGEFRSLIRNHPESQKLTHAMLKVGYIHHELGRPEQARQILTELTERYPQSTAAGLARKRLQRLQDQ